VLFDKGAFGCTAQNRRQNHPRFPSRRLRASPQILGQAGMDRFRQFRPWKGKGIGGPPKDKGPLSAAGYAGAARAPFGAHPVRSPDDRRHRVVDENDAALGTGSWSDVNWLRFSVRTPLGRHGFWGPACLQRPTCSLSSARPWSHPPPKDRDRTNSPGWNRKLPGRHMTPAGSWNWQNSTIRMRPRCSRALPGAAVPSMPGDGPTSWRRNFSTALPSPPGKCPPKRA
jgi:hypothetical protein